MMGSILELLTNRRHSTTGQRSKAEKKTGYVLERGGEEEGGTRDDRNLTRVSPALLPARIQDYTSFGKFPINKRSPRTIF